MRTIIFICASLLYEAAVLSAQSIHPVLVMAHRGGYETFPENTLNAFDYSSQQGVDFVECDVWLTADSVSLVIHDETYGRTTNIEEVLGRDARINELTLAQAKMLLIDGGEGWHPRFAGQMRIPTLDEVLAVVKNHDVGIVIEIKEPASAKSRLNVLQALQNAGIDSSKVILMNFYQNVNGRYKKMVSRLADYRMPSIMYGDNGVILNGDYFLSLDDPIIRKPTFSISGVVSAIFASSGRQYVFSLIDHYDWRTIWYYVRIVLPNRIEFFARLKDGISTGSANYDPLASHRIALSKTQDSIFVMVDDRPVISVRAPSDFVPPRRPRLIVGADQQLGSRLGAEVSQIAIADLADSSNYIFGLMGNTEELNALSKPFVPMTGEFNMDVVGLFLDSYNRSWSEFVQHAGMESVVLTVNDPQRMLDVLYDPHVGAILTGKPLLLQRLIAFGGEIDSLEQPAKFLTNNFPNPFNSYTIIPFSIPKPGTVEMNLYDVTGRMVRVLVDATYAAGSHLASWDGTDDRGRRVSSGVYFLQFIFSDHRQTKKLLLVQ